MSLMSGSRTSNTTSGSAMHRPSFSALAAAAAYGEVIKTVKMQTVKPVEPQGIRTPLRAFGPWEQASFANLRSKRKRPDSEVPSKATPFRPGLELSGLQLQADGGPEALIIKDVLLFPTALAMLKPNWPFCFDFNCTPQLGPPLPDHIAEDLYQKYVCSSPLLRPGRLPYLHIGSTTLGFRLHFYLILPNAGGTPHAVNTGHLTDESLQLIFDHCLCPALQAADAKRQGFTSWMQAMNQSNLNALKSRRNSTARKPEIQEERVHCFLLAAIWEAIECCDAEAVAHLLQGMILVAYGDAEDHPWHADWKATWQGFKRDWENAVEVKNLRAESRLRFEMDLGLEGVEGVVGGDRQGERKRARR